MGWSGNHGNRSVSLSDVAGLVARSFVTLYGSSKLQLLQWNGGHANTKVSSWNIEEDVACGAWLTLPPRGCIVRSHTKMVASRKENRSGGIIGV